MMQKAYLRNLLAGSTLFALMCLPGAVSAQSTGSLRGEVASPNGEPLTGAVIAVDGASLPPGSRRAVTDSNGIFQISALPAFDGYAIEVSFPGTSTTVLSDITISAGHVTQVRIILRPEAEMRERVEVRANPQIVTLEETTTSTRLNSEFIESLPILGRNYQDTLSLAPGVSDVDGDGNPNIHGARETNVVTMLDGVSTVDPLTGTRGAELNIEAIQEIEIKTAGATAEFGRAQGGFVNIITKSGGNEFEGAFKFFWRGSYLDHDGAGIDDPALHGGVGETGLRDLQFNDYTPFFSLGGPIVRDKAWFFTALEYIQIEEPVNALSQAFVRGVEEFRAFAKFTWQTTGNHRLTFSVNHAPQEFFNLGLNSLTRIESGFTTKTGGTILTLRETTILNPNVALETTISHFDQTPERIPTLGPDTNGNGELWFDRNRNGFQELSERDAGEDFDNDGAFDVFEPDLDLDGEVDPSEDLDGDGRFTLSGKGDTLHGCEGQLREDFDCDGRLDNINEDRNGNGILDRGEDLDGDSRLDEGLEDRNQNGVLDDTPFPTTLTPYGRLHPLSADREYVIDRNRGITSGPFFQHFSDRRKRVAFREDLSVFVPREDQSHDVKFGFAVERESFDRDTRSNAITSPFLSSCGSDGCDENEQDIENSTISALLPTEPVTRSEASGLTVGTYIQDTYKPMPNLSLGLGLRFDRERADSTGFRSFDPAVEVDRFNRLSRLAGSTGLGVTGVLTDPIFMHSPDFRKAAGFITTPMRTVALRQLTRHHDTLSFDSSILRFKGILDPGEEVDPSELAARGVSAQSPETFTLTNNNLAPRLSVSWDPWANGKTKVFATWGRFYDKLFLSTVVGEQGPDRVNRYYLIDFDGLQFDRRLDEVGGNHNVGRLVSKAPPSATQVDRGLDTPFSDEFTIGFQREIMPELAFGVTFIDRRFRNQLQDIDINHELRFDGDGQPIDLLGLLDPVQLGRGVQENISDDRPDLYIHNFFFNQILRVGNSNEARYKAIEMTLQKRMSRRWQMQASYTYSRAVGDAEDFQSRLGNDPSTVESEFGYLDYDERHVVKLNTAMFLPRDWQLGVAARWGSGLPFSVASRFFALDDLRYQQFRTRFVTQRRNSERNAAAYDLNLQIRRNVVLGRKVATLSLEVFNVLNSNDLRVFALQDVIRSAGGGLDPTAPAVSGLQIDGERRFGRRFQLGFEISF